MSRRAYTVACYVPRYKLTRHETSFRRVLYLLLDITWKGALTPYNTYVIIVIIAGRYKRIKEEEKTMKVHWYRIARGMTKGGRVVELKSRCGIGFSPRQQQQIWRFMRAELVQA